MFEVIGIITTSVLIIWVVFHIAIAIVNCFRETKIVGVRRETSFDASYDGWDVLPAITLYFGKKFFEIGVKFLKWEYHVAYSFDYDEEE